MNANPGHLAGNINFGNESTRDKDKLPYFPSLFVSDITTDSNNKSGDAQSGGVPYKPDEIYGTWKALNAENPKGNGLKLGGPDIFPQQTNMLNLINAKNALKLYNQFTAEIIWKVDNLGLTPGHTYRAQFILHDGDREGDIGEGCSTIIY